MGRVGSFFVACSLFFCSPAAAQTASHWGVAGSFVPRWEFLHFIEDSMEREVTMEGRDFTIGIVRGRQSSGDWGVSFVKRRIDDDSIVMQQETTKCVARPPLPDLCARGTFHRTRGAEMTGVQVHRFFPLRTIAQRIQIGAVVSGGAARLRGAAEEVKEHLQITVNPVTGLTSVTIADETITVPARTIFDDTGVAEYVPIGGIEAAAAVLVRSRVKFRFAAGASFPGFHTFSVSAQYLFGSR